MNKFFSRSRMSLVYSAFRALVIDVSRYRRRSLLRRIFIGLTLVVALAVIFSEPSEVKNVYKSTNDPLTVILPPHCYVPKLKSMTQLFQFLDKEVYPCKKLLTVGGTPVVGHPHIIDGDKKLCMDSKFNFRQGNCTVLSFGISNDWTFDDAMDKTFGCRVFSFDPSIGLGDHRRSPRSKFYSLGLGSYEGIRDIKNISSKIDRYEGIIYRLGLQNTTIDYLKMDIEGGEFDFFDEIFGTSFYLLSKIQQIGMEIHLGKIASVNNFIEDHWKALHKFECYGFKMMYLYPNVIPKNLNYVDGKVRSRCYEIMWVKI